MKKNRDNSNIEQKEQLVQNKLQEATSDKFVGLLSD